jgi:hypothetical protein
MTNERRVPLDVLVIGAHAHGPSAGTSALLDFLSTHPAVRAFGSVNAEEDAWAAIRANKVNTIFFDPIFGTFDFEYEEKDAQAFVERVRKEFPKIVFVQYTYDTMYYEMFVRKHPRLEHYFHMNHLVPWAEGEKQHQELDTMLRRCEKWHDRLFQYDVALSFAGKDRPYAQELADILCA